MILEQGGLERLLAPRWPQNEQRWSKYSLARVCVGLVMRLWSLIGDAWMTFLEGGGSLAVEPGLSNGPLWADFRPDMDLRRLVRDAWRFRWGG